MRLTAAAGVPEGTHGTYRGRPGTPVAVMTFTALPALPPGRSYQVWALRDGRWVSLGRVQPDASGSARLIVEGPSVATPPQALQVTQESAGGSAAPSGPVMVRWPA